jgi:hypothetical protein
MTEECKQPEERVILLLAPQAVGNPVGFVMPLRMPVKHSSAGIAVMTVPSDKVANYYMEL